MSSQEIDLASTKLHNTIWTFPRLLGLIGIIIWFYSARYFYPGKGQEISQGLVSLVFYIIDALFLFGCFGLCFYREWGRKLVFITGCVMVCCFLILTFLYYFGLLDKGLPSPFITHNQNSLSEVFREIVALGGSSRNTVHDKLGSVTAYLNVMTRSSPERLIFTIVLVISTSIPFFKKEMAKYGDIPGMKVD